MIIQMTSSALCIRAAKICGNLITTRNFGGESSSQPYVQGAQPKQKQKDKVNLCREAYAIQWTSHLGHQNVSAFTTCFLTTVSGAALVAATTWNWATRSLGSTNSPASQPRAFTGLLFQALKMLAELGPVVLWISFHQKFCHFEVLSLAAPEAPSARALGPMDPRLQTFVP